MIEVEKPVPKNHEVRVKIHAVSVNSWDWDILKGIPFMMRMEFGLNKPRERIIGIDIAGRIDSLGSRTAEFQTGDEVFGDISGCGFGAWRSGGRRAR